MKGALIAFAAGAVFFSLLLVHDRGGPTLHAPGAIDLGTGAAIAAPPSSITANPPARHPVTRVHRRVRHMSLAASGGAAATGATTSPSAAPEPNPVAVAAPPTAPPATTPVAPVAPARVTVPNVVGLDESAAIALLRRAGLVVGAVERESSGDAPSGVVLDQEPDAGEVVARGSAVELKVSAGGGNDCQKGHRGCNSGPGSTGSGGGGSSGSDGDSSGSGGGSS